MKKKPTAKPVQKYVRDKPKPNEQFIAPTGKLEKTKSISIMEERANNLRRAKQAKENTSFMKNSAKAKSIEKAVYVPQLPPQIFLDYQLDEDC